MREPADARARSTSLTELFTRAIVSRQGRSVRLVDLAAGAASNLRHLAPHMAAAGAEEQTWRLIDQDASLLAAGISACRAWAETHGWSARRSPATLIIEAPGWRLTARSETADLAGAGSHRLVRPGEAVVLAAFLDLVSQSWLEGFAALLANRGAPLLATGSFDGHLAFRPRMPTDDLVRSRFAAHQQRDKGFGPALGGEAPSALASLLRRQGRTVAVRRSPWLLSARTDAALIGHLLTGIAQAATEQDSQSATAIARWLAQRCDQLAAGTLRVAVGHRDLMALP